MNEDLFNIEIRKFLKRLGVTSQRAIENAIHEALKCGKLFFACSGRLDPPTTAYDPNRA